MKTSRLDKYGKINRDKILSFSWDKKKYKGFEGDTLASALLANNIGIVGRSFKYHRPRGIFSSGVEESGALVTIGSKDKSCLLYTSPSPRDFQVSRMPSSA